MKREPRKETDNLYREREIRGRNGRRSSSEGRRRDVVQSDRRAREERFESHPEFRKSAASRSFYDESFEEQEYEYQEPEVRVRPRKEPGYKEEKEYYYRSLKEHRYTQQREPERERRYYEEEQPRKKKGRGRKAFRAILCILLILVLAVGIIWINPAWRKATLKAVIKSPVGPVLGQLVIGGNYDRYVKDKEYDRSKIRINEGVSIPKGYRTIALFGIDARSEEIGKGTQADTILILSMDQDGNMKMASILRDTYLMNRNDEGSEIIAKANSAFFRGGPIAAVNMLNENFDLAITDYAVVNFWGMANIIDQFGGIYLTVTEEERQEMNFHMHEMHVYFDMKDTPLEASGENVLVNGDQATMFCRLRKIPFYSPVDGITYTDDYGRTARQRYVMMSLVSRVKEMGLMKLMLSSNKLFALNAGDEKFIESSMSAGELTRWFGLGIDMQIAGSQSFPTEEHLYTAMLDTGDTVVADTLEENVSLLHAFLYDEADYVPSSDLVQLADRIRAEVDRQR